VLLNTNVNGKLMTLDCMQATSLKPLHSQVEVAPVEVARKGCADVHVT
jgi:hypothetical protein